MAIGPLETVEVWHKTKKLHMVVNASDFDPKVHERKAMPQAERDRVAELPPAAPEGLVAPPVDVPPEELVTRMTRTQRRSELQGLTTTEVQAEARRLNLEPMRTKADTVTLILDAEYGG